MYDKFKILSYTCNNDVNVYIGKMRFFLELGFIDHRRPDTGQYNLFKIINHERFF